MRASGAQKTFDHISILSADGNGQRDEAFERRIVERNEHQVIDDSRLFRKQGDARALRNERLRPFFTVAPGGNHRLERAPLRLSQKGLSELALKPVDIRLAQDIVEAE